MNKTIVIYGSATATASAVIVNRHNSPPVPLNQKPKRNISAFFFCKEFTLTIYGQTLTIKI